MKIQNLFIIIMFIGFIGSCGSDNKTKNSNTSSPGITNQAPLTESEIAINNLKTSFNCLQGERLTNLLYFTNNTKSNANLFGPFLFGPFSTGLINETISEKYVGISPFSDLMVVTKHDSGFNVILSLCSHYDKIRPEYNISGFDVNYYIGIFLFPSIFTGDFGSARAEDSTLFIDTGYMQYELKIDFMPLGEYNNIYYNQ